MTAFLKENAQQDETILCEPEHLAYPILFYLGDKIRIAGSLTPDSHLDFARLDQLGIRNYRAEQATPDWIFIAASPEAVNYIVDLYSRPHFVDGKVQKVAYKLVGMLNVLGGQPQRPELFWRSFGPVAISYPEREGVLVIRRVATIPTDEPAVELVR
jgi:hypothetical protein